jgi:hypothetical protein
MIKKKISFELFLGVWNTQQNLLTPHIHKRMAAWLSANARRRTKRLVLTAFRGSGKSTLVGLYCAWTLCLEPDTRILVVAADEELAQNMVAHVRHVLMTHILARALVPRTTVSWARDRITVVRPGVMRDPSVRAAGITSNITGGRADIIICDDVEVPKTCDTPLKRELLRRRLGELDFVIVPNGMILYLGTPHTDDSLYAPDGPLADYERLMVPLGENTWPERFDRDTIAHIRAAVGPRLFASQMELQCVPTRDARLDPDLMQPYDTDAAIRVFRCAWDPSFGGNTHDESVIALTGFGDDGHIYLHDMAVLRTGPTNTTAKDTSQDNTPDAATMQITAAHDFILRHNISAIQVEANGLGAFLPGLLRQHLRRHNVTCAVVTHHNTTPKTMRILNAFEGPLHAGRIHIHDRVRTHGFARAMRDWSPDDTNARDDMLDAFAAAIAAGPRQLNGAHPTQFYAKGAHDDVFSV